MDNAASTMQQTLSEKYFCPLFMKNIPESLCYEINSVAFGLCKPSLVNHITNREKAEPVCTFCEHRAM